MKLTEHQIEKLLNSELWPDMTEQQIQDVIELIESLFDKEPA